MSVPPKAEIPISFLGAGSLASNALIRHAGLLKSLARLKNIRTISETEVDAAAKGAIQFVIDEATVFVAVAELIDLGSEKARLDKEMVKQQREIGRFEKKLANASFISKAPQSVVNGEREKLSSAQAKLTRLKKAYERVLATE